MTEFLKRNHVAIAFVGGILGIVATSGVIHVMEWERLLAGLATFFLTGGVAGGRAYQPPPPALELPEDRSSR